MKKTITKTAAKSAPAKKAPAVVSAAKTPAAVPVLRKKKVTAPAVKSGAPAPVLTTITARIDIGFGNALHLRGDGPGLSWDKGVPLKCLGDDTWSIVLGETARPVVFKFLVNDLTWSAGADYVVAPGAVIELRPAFEG